MRALDAASPGPLWGGGPGSLQPRGSVSNCSIVLRFVSEAWDILEQYWAHLIRKWYAPEKTLGRFGTGFRDASGWCAGGCQRGSQRVHGEIVARVFVVVKSNNPTHPRVWAEATMERNARAKATMPLMECQKSSSLAGHAYPAHLPASPRRGISLARHSTAPHSAPIARFSAVSDPSAMCAPLYSTTRRRPSVSMATKSG